MAQDPKRTGGGGPKNGLRRESGDAARGGLERQGTAGLEHRGESLVAMDNPDDSQLGAEPRQPAGEDR